ncbi:MAG: hypothetical protein ACYC6R_13530 [Anaerolineales bacterium]
MSKHNFSRFVYFDTNILSYLAKNKQLWIKLFEFLTKNGLTLGIGGAQIVELSDAKRLHQALAEMFVAVPSAVLKTWDTVLDEEVKAHPQKRTESLFYYPLNALIFEPNGLQKLQDFLLSNKLSDARKDQLFHAQKFAKRHSELKDNFPKSKIGKYSHEQADEFAWIIVMQWLGNTHLDFLAGFKKQTENFHLEVFLSIRIFAHVIFYKYYLGQREPAKNSDFGDLAHLFVLPYCELAIMERDLCNVLNQIKRNQDTLKSTIVRDIDFFEDWSW